MTHYLPTPPPGSKAERQAWLDRTVDAFDLPAYMRQFDETGADWLIFTLIQNNGACSVQIPSSSRSRSCS